MYVALANLTNGGLSGGSLKYLETLAPLLAQNPDISRLDLFVPPNSLAGLRKKSSLLWETWLDHDVAIGFRNLKAEIRRRRPDVVFVPTARWIDTGAIPLVSMVRNMEPLVSPFGENPILETLRMVQRFWVARRACERSTRTIAVSQYVRQHLEQRLGLSAEKVTTIYHGVDPPLSSSAATPPAALRGLSTPFLLTAGSIRPYRRLEDIIHGLSVLTRSRPSIPLVIAGEVDKGMNFYHRRLMSLAERFGLHQQILWVGKLSPIELSWCYSHCAAFIMSSRVEACPNTVLESLAHGCLSISTNAAPMPEMYGDSAAFYTREQPNDLAAKLHSMLSLSRDEQEIYREKARKRSLNFSWQRTAELTVNELAKAVSSRLARRAPLPETTFLEIDGTSWAPSS